MTEPQKSQGTKLMIGTQITDPAGDTFQQVKGPIGIAGIGPEAPIIDATELDDTARRKLKGIPDHGDIEVTGNRRVGDPGQTALKAAAEDLGDLGYNFKIELNDAPTGPAPTPTTYAFKALVTQFRTVPNEVDGKVDFTAILAVTGPSTETPAASGT